MLIYIILVHFGNLEINIGSALLISGLLLKQFSRDGSGEALICNVCQFPCVPNFSWLISTYQHNITELEVGRRYTESLMPAAQAGPSIPLLLVRLHILFEFHRFFTKGPFSIPVPSPGSHAALQLGLISLLHSDNSSDFSSFS